MEISALRFETEGERASESDRIGSDGRKLGFEAFFLLPPLSPCAKFNLEVGRIPRSRMFAEAIC